MDGKEPDAAPVDDIVAEANADLDADVELEEVESSSQQKIKSLNAKVKTLTEEKREVLEELQRAKADFLNTKKRLADERALDRERIVDDHIVALLPLCDSFHMAMSNQEAWEAVDKNWRLGIEGIFSQLNSILSEYNVHAIDPIGVPFDPDQHEAVSTVESDEASDTVVHVLQYGYERNGSIIRPAKVSISQ